MSNNTEILWKKVLEVVRVSVSGANFSAWFSQTFIVELQAPSDTTAKNTHNIAQIGCPSLFVQDTLEKRYRGLLQDALNQVSGAKNDLVFLVRPNTNGKTQQSSPLFNQFDSVDDASLRRARIPSNFSFDSFAVSPSNQLAWSAACAVAKNPATAYNPLFIWGGVGVGKTHLALATAREIINKHPEKKVLCSTGDEFIVGIIEAIRTKTTSEFKKKYRGADILVIDDVSFIAGKDTVQDEFFHTFNQVQRERGQIILTSDRPPYEIPNLENRLQSRFGAGLVVDIGPPDFELRVAILLIKSRQRGFDIPIDVAQQIAEAITSSRQLEGFLARLESRINHQSLALPYAVEELLKAEGKTSTNGNTRKNLNSKDLVSLVCEYFSTNRKQIMGASRKKILVTPRHILMYLLRTELKLPYEEIGRILGGRDHTTIIHGVEKIENQIITNGDLQGNILGIKNKLWGQN